MEGFPRIQEFKLYMYYTILSLNPRRVTDAGAVSRAAGSFRHTTRDPRTSECRCCGACSDLTIVISTSYKKKLKIMTIVSNRRSTRPRYSEERMRGKVTFSGPGSSSGEVRILMSMCWGIGAPATASLSGMSRTTRLGISGRDRAGARYAGLCLRLGLESLTTHMVCLLLLARGGVNFVCFQKQI